MKPLRLFALLYLCVLLLPSCKKDRLQWNSVFVMDAHTHRRLNRVQFMGSKICMAAGGEKFLQAVVLKSTDGGFHWQADSFSQAGKGMYGLTVAPSGKIYMCGMDGTVLSTPDTGRTWATGRLFDWGFYVSAAFPTADTGIFISTSTSEKGIVTTADTAMHIIRQQSFSFGLNNIYMLNHSTGYICGFGAILKTNDGGLSWGFLDVKGDNFTCMDIHGDEMWACGINGGVYHSRNAGATWETLRNGNDFTLPAYRLNAIVFLDRANGWAAGDDGLLLHTVDGGRHWMEYERFTSNSLRAIALYPDAYLLVAGDNGALYRVR